MNKNDAKYWLRVQRKLQEKGFDPGPLDGIRGPKTDAAIVAFKRSIGYRGRPYLGPLTEAALFDDAKLNKPKDDNRREPCWLRRAKMEIGVREIKGSRHSAAVLGYWERAKLYFKSDEIPWCAGFVGAMLEDCGILSTRSGMARSYSYGWGRQLDKPIPGAIVVFWRGSKEGTSGHVGFVAGVDQYRNIQVLGGNQSDEVNIKPFSTGRVIGYYWPKGVPVPGEDNLAVIDSDGKTSTNEA